MIIITTNFIRSPLFENWFYKAENIPKESLIICSPYFKKSAFDQIFDYYSISNDKCEIDIKVLIRGQLNDFIQGSSDIATLELLNTIKKIEVRRLTNLHMKAYLIDNKNLLIGSGNCTNNGLFANNYSCNVEGAIATDEKLAIKDFNNYYKEICLNSESLNTFYSEIVEQYTEYINKHKINKIISNSIDKSVREKERNFRYSIKSNISKHSKKKKINIRIDKKNNTINEQYKIESDIDPSDIPQFSQFSDGAFQVPSVLSNYTEKGLTFIELGKILLAKDKNKKNCAYTKYGENHAKLAELLDLATITHERPRKIYLTKLGNLFLTLDEQSKVDLIKNQIFRMKIIKDIINKYSDVDFNINKYLLQHLSLSTAKRRLPNIKCLFTFLKDNGVENADVILKTLL